MTSCNRLNLETCCSGACSQPDQLPGQLSMWFGISNPSGAFTYTYSSCTSLDLSCRVSEFDAGGPPRPDAGPLRDAGGNNVDSGIDPNRDAGAGDLDGGPNGMDAGRPGGGTDGAVGTFDAGPSEPFDAGDPAVTGFRFGGGAGCSCRVRGAPRDAPLWPLVLGMVALLLRSRRRR